MRLSNLLQILLIRRVPGRDRLRPGGVRWRDGGDDDDDAISVAVEWNIGMLPRHTGQELRRDSHVTMQSEWYRWSQGSRRAGAEARRGSVQMGQTSAVSVTVTVGRAAMDSAGAACDPPRWGGVSNVSS
jgi:hypothetical protein